MLSDYVISGLYMRVLKLTWEKFDFCEFPQFSEVSEWSGRTVSLGVRKDQQSGQYSLGVRTGMEPNRPNGICLRLDSCGNLRPDGDVTCPEAHDLSACSQCSMRPDDVIAPSGRGPHRGYIYPRVPHSFPYPTQSPF
jgi:hypothetical protein